MSCHAGIPSRSADAAASVSEHQDVRQRVQPSELRSCAGRCPAEPRWSPSSRPNRVDARRNRRTASPALSEIMTADVQHARPARGRGPSSARSDEQPDENRARVHDPVLKAREDRAEHLAGQRAAAAGSAASSVAKIAGAATNPSAASPPTQIARRPAATRSAIRRLWCAQVRATIAAGTVDFCRAACLNHHSPFSTIIATQLRIDSVRSTTEAGSGHPTTCLSAADIVAALFFAEMRFDPQDPQHPEADRFVLSKGHARADALRRLGRGRRVSARRSAEAARADSDLEGHPTPRLPFVDVATGSLGQGLAPASASRSTRAGSAPTTAPTCCSATARPPKDPSGRPRRSPRSTSSTISARSPTSTASARAARRSGSTTLDEFVARWRAFGWHAVSIDGHDMTQVLAALAEARATTRPADDDRRADAEGQGLFDLRGQGQLARQGAEEGRGNRQAIAELEAQYVKTSDPAPVIPKPARRQTEGPLPDFVAAHAGARLQARRQRRHARGLRHGARRARRASTAASSRSTPT